MGVDAMDDDVRQDGQLVSVSEQLRTASTNTLLMVVGVVGEYVLVVVVCVHE